jgi:hypothetical protein
VNSDSLSSALQSFLLGSRDAAVIEDGGIIFDLRSAKYSISGERDKCLLHLWSAERNVVRRVVDLKLKNDVLRLAVLRLGQACPSKLEICRERDRRSPSARKAIRTLYQSRLRRALKRHFPDFTLSPLSCAMDLERSFGPIYARGLLRKGQKEFSVLGVNQDETQASVDAALTFGILWLQACREKQGVKSVVEGLKLILPAQRSALARERMQCLDRDAAKWQLYEFNERDDALTEVDCSDRGNIETRLVHCPDEVAARGRFATSIARIRRALPEAEAYVSSPAEVAFRLHGLEVARARPAHEAGTMQTGQEIVFGVGAEERVLNDKNEREFLHLAYGVAEVRHDEGPRDHPLFRLHPERWLESVVVKKVSAIDERLDPAHLYSQVPAFSASDRAMIDVLTRTRAGRLAVIELKAEEDIHLPLQGLDYWARVKWHHERDEFKKCGYFPGAELSPEPPRLFLVGPTLHVHPATDTLLRYISPEIDWTLVGIDERWRRAVRVVFRKHRDSRLQMSDCSFGSGLKSAI